MAVDQREALIAAVRAQVEKERAEKQKKLEREQEAMAFSKKKSGGNKEEGHKKYKTLSPEELARIEEKKRKKRAEELGIPYEPSDAFKAADTPAEGDVDIEAQAIALIIRQCAVIFIFKGKGPP